MTRRSQLPCLLLVAAVLAGCRSSGPQPVDNALVAEAAPEARARVASARAARDEAIDLLALAEREGERAELAVDAAAAAQRTTRARLSEAEVALASAEHGGTHADVQLAGAREAYLRAEVEVAGARVEVARRAQALAARTTRLRTTELAHAEAVVELRKAEAVAADGRASSRELRLEDFRRSVEVRGEAVEQARAALKEPEKDLARARARHAALVEHAEALRPTGS